MSWTQEEMNQIYVKVQKLASTDEEFRELLVKDPNAAITKVSGKELPEGFKVKVVENDPAYQATFVLPDFIGDEIEEGDLEGVAGGFAFIAVVSACAAAITISGHACAAATGK